MTLPKQGPYTSLSIRFFLFIGPVALASCATSGAAPQSELTELKAEMRAIREENARLEKRLDRVELHGSIAPPPMAVPSRLALNIPDPGPEAVPSLTVVKLKPRQQAAPKIATGVAIVEPAPEVLDALKSAAVDDPPEEEDKDMGEAFFEQGVNALKTGNVAGGILELQKFAAASPRHPRADNAIYFSGLGLMGLSDFEGVAQMADAGRCGGFERSSFCDVAAREHLAPSDRIADQTTHDLDPAHRSVLGDHPQRRRFRAPARCQLLESDHRQIEVVDMDQLGNAATGDRGEGVAVHPVTAGDDQV